MKRARGGAKVKGNKGPVNWTVNGELPSSVGKNKAIEAHDLDQ